MSLATSEIEKKNQIIRPFHETFKLFYVKTYYFKGACSKIVGKLGFFKLADMVIAGEKMQMLVNYNGDDVNV